MKIYRKEVRPMVQPPSLQGFSNKPYPFFTEDSWVIEDFRDYFQLLCENKLEDPMSTIVFDERYVEVELPTPEADLQEQRDYERFVELLKSMPGVTITDFADKCNCGEYALTIEMAESEKQQ